MPSSGEGAGDSAGDTIIILKSTPQQEQATVTTEMLRRMGAESLSCDILE